MSVSKVFCWLLAPARSVLPLLGGVPWAMGFLVFPEGPRSFWIIKPGGGLGDMDAASDSVTADAISLCLFF